MREFVIRRLRRAPIIRDLWDEYERMAGERDLAISDRIASLEARDRAIAAQVNMEKKIEELLSDKSETLQVVSDNEKPFLRKIQYALDFNPHINEWEVLRGTQYSRYLL